MKLMTESVLEMQSFAARLGRELPVGTVLALMGDLGSGKTTFCQGLATGLGVKEMVTSPTFKLVSGYEGDRCWFYHVDCYRLGSPEEFLNIDGEKYLSPDDGISAIEWADRIDSLLSQKVVKAYFKCIPGKPNTRSLEIRGWEF